MLGNGQNARLKKEIFWVGAGQAVTVLGMVVGVRLLTNVLSPDLYGELALGMTAAMLIQQVIMGPLGNASLRFFTLANESGECPGFVAALRRLLVQATIIILSFAALASLVLAATRNSGLIGLGVAAFAFAMVSGYSSVIDGIQNAARQRPVVAWHQALSTWGRFLAAVGLVTWLGAKSSVAMLGYVIASLLVLGSQTYFFKQKIMSGVARNSGLPNRSVGRPWRDRIFSYSWPFASWGIFTWAQMASGRWALEFFSSTANVGFYAVLFQIGYYPIMIASTVLVQLISPIIFEHAGDASDPARMNRVYLTNWRLTVVTMILTLAATILSVVLHPWIFRLFVAREYQSVSWMLPGLVLAGGLFAAGQFLSLSLMSSTESRILIAPKIATAVFGIGLNIVGAFLLGVLGVAIAGLVFSIAFLLWILRLVRSKQGQLAGSPSLAAMEF